LSGKEDIKVRLSGEDARSLDQPIQVDVVRADNGALVETVTLLRYAGHYRADSVHAYAIKDSEGKFRVRGEIALGLSDSSPFVCYVSTAAPVFAA
jgi:hypothetical protein